MTVAATPPATQRWSFGRHVALSAGWFGFNFHWLPIGFILIQSQIRDLVPKGSEGTSIGVAVGLGGIFAVTVPPLQSWLESRTRNTALTEWLYWKVLLHHTNRGYRDQPPRHPQPLTVLPARSEVPS